MGCEAENLNFLVPLVPICSENLWAGNGISGAKNTPTSPVLSCGLSRPLPYLYRPLTVFTKLKIPFMFHCFFFSFNFRQSIWFAHLGDAKHGGTQPPHTLLLWSDPYMVFIVIVDNHPLLWIGPLDSLLWDCHAKVQRCYVNFQRTFGESDNFWISVHLVFRAHCGNIFFPTLPFSTNKNFHLSLIPLPLHDYLCLYVKQVRLCGDIYSSSCRDYAFILIRSLLSYLQNTPWCCINEMFLMFIVVKPPKAVQQQGRVSNCAACAMWAKQPRSDQEIWSQSIASYLSLTTFDPT